MDVIAGTSLDDRGDVFRQIAITLISRNKIKVGQTFGLLCPANVAGRKMRGAKFITNTFGKHPWSNIQEKVT